MLTNRLWRFGALTILLVISLLFLGNLSGSLVYGLNSDPTQGPPPPTLPDDNPDPDQLGGEQAVFSQPASHAPLAVTGGVWLPQGFSPANNGQVEGSTMTNRPVVGAIHTVAAHPTNADIMYIGTTNGGIWKTTNATATNPTWIPQTDSASSMSIGALEFDPTDATHETLVAGFARYSSFASRGGPRDGLLRTTDGGATWHPLNSLSGKNISGIAPRGSTILASVNTADNFACSELGLFRSTDTGASFVKVGPPGMAFDLAGNPTDNAVFYSGLTYVGTCSGGSLQNGIYKSTDTGATWTKVSNAAMDAMIIDGTTNNIEIDSYGQHVFVNIIQSGQSVGIFYSGNGGASWTQMDLPLIPGSKSGTIANVTPGAPIQITTSSAHGLNNGDLVQITNVTGTTGANGIHTITVVDSTNFTLNGTNDSTPWGGGGNWEELVGMHPAAKPGSQGGTHASIRIDPSNPTTVYVGGDRQDSPFPNYIGATDYSGNLWRGDATVAATGTAPSPQWEHLTHSNSVAGIPGGGTAHGSAPHADSREMVIDANGDLIETDDGGISRRTNPQNNTGDWYSLDGNLQIAEIHDIAWDNLSNRIISGNQDTGSTYQMTPGHVNWDSISTGDGGDVVVDNLILAAQNQSVRYTSYQNLSGFQRSVWDADGNWIGSTYPPLNVTGGGNALVPQFVTPLAINNVVGGRLLLGGDNSIYESLDEGDTITEIGVGMSVNSSEGHTIDYGAAGNPGAFYAAFDTDKVAVRLGDGEIINTYVVGPANGAALRGIVMDPDNVNTAFVIDSDQVFRTTDGGASWSDITGGLSDNNLHAIAAGPGLLFVGGSRGVYMMEMASPGNWSQFGTGLPNTAVWDLDYDDTDKMLVAGMLGRGAWLLPVTDAADPVIYAAPDVSTCSTNAPCLAVTDPIKNALTSVVSPGTVHVLGAHSLTGPLVSGNNGANNVTIEGDTGNLSSTLNISGDGFKVGPGNMTVRGLNLSGASTVFVQSGGSLTAYANDITGWTKPWTSTGGTASLGNNWWGISDYNAADPGLPSGDWDKRLGADIESWNFGDNSAALDNANLSGGTGTAIIVSYGRGQSNAPFGNGTTPSVNDMCSDYYDFFVRNASGSWNVTVPVDNNTNCNTNTLNQNKLGWISDISQCAPSNTLCWDTAPNVSHSGQTLVSSGLSSTQLNGTHFTAGDSSGNDPTVINLSAVNGVQSSPLAFFLLAVLAFGLFAGLGLLFQRRRLS